MIEFLTKHSSDLFSLANIIILGIYVFFTRKTFIEIKKQTELQMNAYLSVEVKKFTSLEEISKHYNNEFSFDYIQNDITDKWKNSLKRIFNFNDEIYQGEFFTIILKNHGNAEVKSIEANLEIYIENSEELIEKFNLAQDDIKDYKIRIKEHISPNEKLVVPLISTAVFPNYVITFHGKCFDIRDKEYILDEATMDGDNPQFIDLPKD